MTPSFPVSSTARGPSARNSATPVRRGERHLPIAHRTVLDPAGYEHDHPGGRSANRHAERDAKRRDVAMLSRAVRQGRAIAHLHFSDALSHKGNEGARDRPDDGGYRLAPMHVASRARPL